IAVSENLLRAPSGLPRGFPDCPGLKRWLFDFCFISWLRVTLRLRIERVTGLRYVTAPHRGRNVVTDRTQRSFLDDNTEWPSTRDKVGQGELPPQTRQRCNACRDKRCNSSVCAEL